MYISGGIFYLPQNFKNNVMRREREPDFIITNIHQNQMFFQKQVSIIERYLLMINT